MRLRFNEMAMRSGLRLVLTAREGTRVAWGELRRELLYIRVRRFFRWWGVRRRWKQANRSGGMGRCPSPAA